MKEGTKAEDTKPKHTDEHTDKHTDEHTDNPQMNTLTNRSQTCEDILGEAEPGEGGHEGGRHKAETH